VIKKLFNKEKMDTHMNADEAAVFGSAFYGAAQSRRYKAAGVKV
jgi:molecular chaperone DnaK (HSP70)